MHEPEFDAHKTTIIEAPAQETQLPSPAEEIKAAQVERVDANRVLVKTDCDHERF